MFHFRWGNPFRLDTGIPSGLLRLADTSNAAKMFILMALVFANVTTHSSRISFNFLSYPDLVPQLNPPPGSSYRVIAGIGFSIVFVLSLGPWGRAADDPKFGRCSVVLAGLLIQLICTALQGFVADIWSLLVCRLCLAFGQAAIAAPGLAIIANIYLQGGAKSATDVFTSHFRLSGSLAILASMTGAATLALGGQSYLITYAMVCGAVALGLYLAASRGAPPPPPPEVRAPRETLEDAVDLLAAALAIGSGAGAMGGADADGLRRDLSLRVARVLDLLSQVQAAAARAGGAGDAALAAGDAVAGLLGRELHPLRYAAAHGDLPAGLRQAGRGLLGAGMEAEGGAAVLARMNGHTSEVFLSLSLSLSPSPQLSCKHVPPGPLASPAAWSGAYCLGLRPARDLRAVQETCGAGPLTLVNGPQETCGP
jgi:MFS family permease